MIDTATARSWTCAGAAALAGLVSAGCGGDQTPSAGGQPKFEEAALKHARCMRQNGVEVPDPKPGKGGLRILEGPRGGAPGTERLRRAEERCEKLLDDLPPPKLSAEKQSELRDDALAHARCMRKHGVDFPDPTFSKDGGVRVEIGDGFDPAEPRVKRAEAKCRPTLPTP